MTANASEAPIAEYGCIDCGIGDAAVLASVLAEVGGVCAFFMVMTVATIWAYHFVYRKSLRSMGRLEMTLVIPAMWPALLIVWWVIGLYHNGITAASASSHYWVWWMPISAVAIYSVGVCFARWNRERVANKQMLNR